MEKALFFILAGGRGRRLAPLTDNCPKPLLHFGFSSRIIDFTLYNCLISAGIEIILLTQHLSEMIEKYVSDNWKQAFEAQGKSVQVSRGNDFRKGYYSGTADAVYQNLSAIIHLPELVVVLAADHIYRMNYQSLVRFHVDHGKAATVCAAPCAREQAARFGIITGGPDGTIRSFHEKPESLEGLVPPQSSPLASMGIYAFSTAPLLKYLTRNQKTDSNDFGKDVLPEIVESRDALAYPFLRSDGQGAYWRDVGDLAAYRRANEEYLGGQHLGLRFDYASDMNRSSNALSANVARWETGRTGT